MIGIIMSIIVSAYPTCLVPRGYFEKNGKTERIKIVKYEFRGRVYTKQKLLEMLNNE